MSHSHTFAAPRGFFQRLVDCLWYMSHPGVVMNLNDPRWGRDRDEHAASENSDEGRPSADRPHTRPQGRPEGRPEGRQDGPPDLDEMWRDFNRKLGQLFGGQGGGRQTPPGGFGDGPSMGSKISAGFVLAAVTLIWLASGFFIVQEGQQAVILQFGKYSHVSDAGFKWRMPYPIQSHEIVNVSQLRSVEIGRGAVIKATGLRESSMLTQDENIIDLRFAVQYKLKDARAYLFENRNPDDTVTQAAETAVREVVGKSTMDNVLYEGREKVAQDIQALSQQILDRYKSGIQISSVTLQNVQPPEQVQAAFDDAVKAGQDMERLKNEGQAYANDVIPKAQGTASRLMEEAEGYKARVVAQAQGDAQRFSQVLTEYKKAPGVTKDRMYLDTMQQIYNNVTKVMVDSRQGSNLLYLPLDKLIQQSGASTPAALAPAPASSGGGSLTPSAAGMANTSETPAPALTQPPAAPLDARNRDAFRTRDR